MPTLAEFLVRADEFSLVPSGNTMKQPIARAQGRSVSRRRDDTTSVRGTPDRVAKTVETVGTAVPTTANT
ncbi:hypothetical protein [Natrialba sp. PRR66]|uniref:hypothetical protein n=1 Tax=Natrialba sp. PRR66 TaxID=3098146 RepID=UPI002B1D8CB0|nr:hypothetical protein [Natrialba sp. PRR66]